MRLAGRKLLMVVAPRGFRDEELFIPWQLFESLGARLIVASTRWRSPDSLVELARRNVRPAEQDVVCADRIITGSGPQAAKRWARAIIEAIANPEPRKGV